MQLPVTAELIKRLSPVDFVALLGQLLYAEAMKAEVPMSGVSVPLQITTADGGEDGRFDCKWAGGRAFTDFLPNRFCVFQAKATKIARPGWRAEVHTKGSKKLSTPVLNSAVTNAIAQNGAYIGFTNRELGGDKIEDYVAGIREGIAAAGGSVVSLHVDIYDGNKIAQWVALHPSVGLWLIEKVEGTKLVGYMSFDGWIQKAEFAKPDYINDHSARFALLAENSTISATGNTLLAQNAAIRILDYLSVSGRSFRLIGHSGLGKSRFIAEMFRTSTGPLAQTLCASAVFCDYREVNGNILETANWFARQKTPTLLVVDECPKDIAERLHSIAGTQDSRLKILTINLDDLTVVAPNFMCMRVLRAEDDIINAILKQLIVHADPGGVAFIRQFCAGFPRIAVILGESYSNLSPVLRSVDEVVARILDGAAIKDREAVRALECLSLFTEVAADGKSSDSFDHIASSLGEMTGNRMFEHVAFAKKHELVGERDGRLSVQLRPVADFLATERLSSLRVSTVFDFVTSAKANISLAMFRRWGEIPFSHTAERAAQRLLYETDLGSWDYIDSQEGALAISALVDFLPERLAKHLLWKITEAAANISAESSGRRILVSALSKLAFPESSFLEASEALLKLATAEEDTENGTATKAFGQIFQSFLSGTVVPPEGRWLILDNALHTADPRYIAIVMSALGRALETSYIGRPGGIEKLGRRPALKDWTPRTWAEVFDFQTKALGLLMSIWREHKTHRPNIEAIIGSRLRGLLNPQLVGVINEIIVEVLSITPVWAEAYKKIGDWIYYDSAGQDVSFVTQVKTLQRSLIPTDIVNQALIFAAFWPADIHNPDRTYKEQDVKPEYDYGSQLGKQAGGEIAKDLTTALRAVSAFATQNLNNITPVMMEIGLKSDDPLTILSYATKISADADTASAKSVVASLLAGIDARNDGLTGQALEIGRSASSSPEWTRQILSSITMNANVLQQVVEEINAGRISPESAGFLSYGQRLNIFADVEIVPLLDALIATRTADGLWAVLEIVLMYGLSAPGPHPVLRQYVKALVVAPGLLTDKRRGSNDGHVYETLVLTALREGEPDATFVRQLSEQIVRLCQGDGKIFHELDHALRVILPALVEADSQQTWEVISRFYEVATSVERYMLVNLLSAGADTYDRDLTQAGPLFGAHQIAEDWAFIAPDDRIGFLVSMYPMLKHEASGETGVWSWTPEFDRLSQKFGKFPEFREAVDRRIWELTGGFANEHAARLIEALTTWTSRGELMVWAKNLIQLLKTQNAETSIRDR